MEILITFFIFIFGLTIGSFLNVVILRLEKKESFLKGRSYCPHCKNTLSWFDLVPVFSFIWLGGKCRNCKKRVSWQYPLVELATATVFLLIYNLGLPIFSMLLLWFIASALVVIFVYDLRNYIIPDVVLFPAIIAALPYHISVHYLLAAGLASGFFLAIFLISRGKWMGFGDVKLAILLGLLLGFPNILAGLFLAFFFGAITGIASIVLNKKGLKSEMPFAPFLIFGTFLAMFWGSNLIEWYLHLFLKY